MNIATFSFIVFGVLLNAVAQLLLKAGAKNVGEIHLTLGNLFSVGLKVATQLPIIGGLTCYVLSVVLWIIANLVTWIGPAMQAMRAKSQ